MISSTLRPTQQRYPDAAIVVPGHDDPGGVELLAHTLELCPPVPVAAAGGMTKQ